MAATETISAEFLRITKSGDDWVIGQLANKLTVIGPKPAFVLQEGLTYRFRGSYHMHPRFGRQFKFTSVTTDRPHSRRAVVKYLECYIHGIGPSGANQLCDVLGAENVIETWLKNPLKIKQILPRLSMDQVRDGQNDLQGSEDYRNVDLELLELLNGSGMYSIALVQRAFTRWGVHAAEHIRNNPFDLLRHGFPRCGFPRVDTLYKTLGHDPTAMIRQCMAVWYALKSDSSGSTWIKREHLVVKLRQWVDSGLRAEDAITEALCEQWICGQRINEEWHFADTSAALAETSIAKELARLI